MVAIQTQTLSSENWGQLVRGETISVTEDDISHDTRALLTAMVLKPCIATCKFVQAAIGAMESDIPSPMIHFALERWKQIQIFAENCS